MKYTTYPPNCGFEDIIVDEDNKTATLHFDDLMQVGDDSDLSKPKKDPIEISYQTENDIIDAIEKYGHRRPIRLVKK